MAEGAFECILVGGGLQNGLVVLALQSRNPQARIALIEREPRLGGNHTWCYHAGDLSAAAHEWIDPLVVHRWRGYHVIFPNLTREIDAGYSAITSDRLHDVVSSSIEGTSGSELILGTSVTRVGETEVELENGRTICAPFVVDARGPGNAPELPSSAGFQKFLGLELALRRPHTLKMPCMMDATVDQSEGFRFIYCLPLAADRILVEDTYFHESPLFDRERLREEVLRYAASKEYEVDHVIREETGVLPMPWSGSLPLVRSRPLQAGYRGGWFHPATGYSLPVAARLADWVATRDAGDVSGRGFASLSGVQRSQARYCHVLNRFLFRWYPPHMRWHIFERFYRLPRATIDRFYSLEMTMGDRIRLLVGKPPRGLSLRYRMRQRTSS